MKIKINDNNGASTGIYVNNNNFIKIEKYI